MKTQRFLMILVISFCMACQINNGNDMPTLSSLKGTKWKLAGIVDNETGVLKVLEPNDCVECYTLTFDTDSTFFTYSSYNHLGGKFVIDYDKCSFQLTDFGGTKAGEFGDGYLYVNPFWKRTIQSFSYMENELKLFFNENKSYLLFKPKKS